MGGALTPLPPCTSEERTEQGGCCCCWSLIAAAAATEFIINIFELSRWGVGDIMIPPEGALHRNTAAMAWWFSLLLLLCLWMLLLLLLLQILLLLLILLLLFVLLIVLTLVPPPLPPDDDLLSISFIPKGVVGMTLIAACDVTPTVVTAAGLPTLTVTFGAVSSNSPLGGPLLSCGGEGD